MRGPRGGLPGALGTYAAAESEDELWADTPPAADTAGVRQGFGDGGGNHPAERGDSLRGDAEAERRSKPGGAGDVAAGAATHRATALGQAPLAADREQALHAASQGQPGVQHPGGAGAEHSQGGPGVT